MQQVEEGELIKQFSKLDQNQMIFIGNCLGLKEFMGLRQVNSSFKFKVQKCFPQLQIQEKDKLNIMQENQVRLHDKKALTLELVQKRLSQFKKAELNLILSLQQPPPLVFDVLQVVNTLVSGLKCKQNLTFDEIKTSLRSQDLQKSLVNLEIENLNAYQISVLDSITHTVKQAQIVSIAISTLLDFVIGLKELAKSPSFIRRLSLRYWISIDQYKNTYFDQTSLFIKRGENSQSSYMKIQDQIYKDYNTLLYPNILYI
ncbi:hypothetical protein pb186bvf_019745 [Paramecium bursaria]